MVTSVEKIDEAKVGRYAFMVHVTKSQVLEKAREAMLQKKIDIATHTMIERSASHGLPISGVLLRTLYGFE